MHNFFRKLSIRARSPPAPKKKSSANNMLKKNSSGLLRFIRNNDKPDEEPTFDMPMHLMIQVIDRMPFFEQIRQSRVCKEIKEHIEEKYSKIKKLELRKRDINEACASDDAFERHSKAYVAVKIEKDTACVVIDDAWVVADFYVFLEFWNMIHVPDEKPVISCGQLGLAGVGLPTQVRGVKPNVCVM